MAPTIKLKYSKGKFQRWADRLWPLVLLGAVIIGEPITRDVVVGLTIVLGGVLLVTTGERKS